MADVLNRTTKQLLRSVNSPDYDPADWIINPDLSGVSGVPVVYWKIDGDTVSEMSQAEKDAVDAANLPAYKAALVKKVDAETQRRIALGFEFPPSSGNVFSLSKEAQLNYLGMKTYTDALPYPFDVRTLDDTGFITISNATETNAFLDVGFVTKETWITTGRLVKTAVMAAADAAAADAAAATYLAGG